MGNFTNRQIAQLGEKLSDEHVKQQQNQDYLPGWFVIDQANRIFGHDRWNYEVTDFQFVGENEKGNKLVYLARVRVTVVDEDGDVIASREDVGMGDQKNKREILDAHGNAAKAAVTDALKRALRGFGNQFGNPLYDPDNVNVETEADRKARVKRLKEERGLTKEVVRKSSQMLKDIPNEQARAVYERHGVSSKHAPPEDFDPEAFLSDLKALKQSSE
jgi:DNA repair and recombination protein RAD52